MSRQEIELREPEIRSSGFLYSDHIQTAGNRHVCPVLGDGQIAERDPTGKDDVIPFSDRADWRPTKEAVQCPGTPVRSNWVMNHFLVLWNTNPGRSRLTRQRCLANAALNPLI
ncbi:hypothetical protein [Aestuariicoccus sp. MJ-SS9]|uniref:hypothetical protein n=1 Tax=Aestuariicoccus sp. MJ-SS9 TaxID=3079855 RepID=UPI00290E585E|nr:hypothetical protein [Aestuariicoccus sp. MJ-SS9]MDU8911440.1 hypothetical protein [Aestuariicoccus sp. MJ-SS9]